MLELILQAGGSAVTSQGASIRLLLGNKASRLGGSSRGHVQREGCSHLRGKLAVALSGGLQREALSPCGLRVVDPFRKVPKACSIPSGLSIHQHGNNASRPGVLELNTKNPHLCLGHLHQEKYLRPEVSPQPVA